MVLTNVYILQFCIGIAVLWLKGVKYTRYHKFFSSRKLIKQILNIVVNFILYCYPKLAAFTLQGALK